MRKSFVCQINIYLISVLAVCGLGFGQQNTNLYNRKVRPNSEIIYSPENAMFLGKAHSRPKTNGLEDTVEKSLENRSPLRESASHLRYQMPYPSNDRHQRTTIARQQPMQHQSHPQQQQLQQPSLFQNSLQMQIHLPDKYQKPFQLVSAKQPKIIENSNNFRIFSPHEREDEFEELQNINKFDPNNRQRFVTNSGDRNRQNMDYSHQNRNPKQDTYDESRELTYPNSNVRPNPTLLGMKVVLPKNREESRVQGFESFSSNVNHEETDKFYPKFGQKAPEFPLHSPLEESQPEELTEDYSDPSNAPKNEVEFQRHLNLFPPVMKGEEDLRRRNLPNNEIFFDSYSKQKPDSAENGNENHNYFDNHSKGPKPLQTHSIENQFYQNKANQQNIRNYGRNNAELRSERLHNIPYESINAEPIAQTFHTDRNGNAFQFQRNHMNKQRNRFDLFRENDLQRQSTEKPTKSLNTYSPRESGRGRPVKKEIALFREITQILPSDDEAFQPIAFPSPPDPPIDYKLFDEKQNKSTENPDLSKEENFYDEDDGLGEGERTTPKPTNMDNDEEDVKETKGKSKFEKEVDLSADELENYFDKEFSTENERDKEGMGQLEFDDEAKESNQQVSKKETNEDKIDLNTDELEADYKDSKDFLKNHDNFLNQIERENEKFRKRTEDKVQEDDSEDKDLEQSKATVDDGEKELDAESDKKEEETEDSKQSDQKNDKNGTEEEETNDSNEETKDKSKTDEKEVEDEEEEESEAKAVTDKEKSDKNNDNQKSEKKQEKEEQEEDNTSEDEEESDKQKSDNTETGETNDSIGEKEEKNDKCIGNGINCDKELLKEEESKKSEELKSEDEEESDGKEEEEEVVETTTGKTTEKSIENSSEKEIEAKPIDTKQSANRTRTLRIAQTHNFAPFIDLKRINPNKSNIRKGVEQTDTQTGWTSASTSPSSSSSIKSTHSDQSIGITEMFTLGVTSEPDSKPANKQDNITREPRHAINSIYDIIKSQKNR